MSRLALACVVVGLLAPRWASADEARTPAGATESPTYRPMRYLEDYAHLANVRRDGWDRVKYIPLGALGYLSLGGQHRLRYELLDPVDPGAMGEGASSVLLARHLLHADVHPLEGLRVFGQLGSFQMLGIPSSGATPPDANDLDVTQLFLESRVTMGSAHLVTRAGRQEMTLGSTRWVSTRDGTNVRQAFDLVGATLSVPRAWTLELFLGTTPELRRGAFDDAPAWQDGFWGGYATIAVLPRKRLGVDAFYLGRRRHEAIYAAIGGREARHMLGTRLFGETDAGLEYIAHAMAQTGSIGERSILAWGLSGALWQRLPRTLAPLAFGLRADALSGDRRPSDGVLTTFHPFFPNQTFFSALPAIYPTNLYDVHPLVRLEGHQVSVEGGCVFFWRQASEDAIYEPPGAPIDAGDGPRYTGAQTSLSFAYRPDRHLSVHAEYSRIVAGPGLSRGDVDFFGTWTTFTY